MKYECAFCGFLHRTVRASSIKASVNESERRFGMERKGRFVVVVVCLFFFFRFFFFLSFSFFGGGRGGGGVRAY